MQNKLDFKTFIADPGMYTNIHWLICKRMLFAIALYGTFYLLVTVDASVLHFIICYVPGSGSYFNSRHMPYPFRQEFLSLNRITLLDNKNNT